MSTINSPLGTKTYATGVMREYVVPDETENMEVVNPYARQQMGMPVDPIRQSLEEERRVKDNRLAPAARKRIEMLCGMSSLTREVNIDQNIFVLKSLRAKDNRQTLLDAMKYDGTVEFSFELRRQVLARSLLQIAGSDVEAFLGTSDFKARLEFLDELDEAVLDRLYNEYLILSKEIKDKYSLVKEEEVKEAIEDIKKS